MEQRLCWLLTCFLWLAQLPFSFTLCFLFKDLFLLFNIYSYYFNYMHLFVCVGGYVYINVGAQGDQRHQISPELDF